MTVKEVTQSGICTEQMFFDFLIDNEVPFCTPICQRRGSFNKDVFYLSSEINDPAIVGLAKVVFTREERSEIDMYCRPFEGHVISGPMLSLYKILDITYFE